MAILRSNRVYQGVYVSNPVDADVTTMFMSLLTQDDARTSYLSVVLKHYIFNPLSSCSTYVWDPGMVITVCRSGGMSPENCKLIIELLEKVWMDHCDSVVL